MALPPMRFRTLGRTGLRVSVIGLGTGGPSQLGQGSGVPEADAQRLVRHALESGVNLIDTAAQYRESETILGHALAGIPRDRYVLCTKFGPVDKRGNTVRSVEDLQASLERSLQRLGTDYLDLFQLHGVEPEWYERARDQFLPALKRSQESGKVRYIGISETFANDHEKMTLGKALADNVWDVMMVGYNMLTLSPEREILPLAKEQNVGILVMCAVRRAIARPDKLAALVRQLKDENLLPRDALPDSGPLDWLVHGEVESVPAAAYKYVAANPAVSTVLTGTANIAHFDDNVQAILGASLPPDDVARIRRLFGNIKRNLGD